MTKREAKMIGRCKGCGLWDLEDGGCIYSPKNDECAKRDKKCEKTGMICLCLECKENQAFHPDGHCSGCKSCKSEEDSDCYLFE